MHTKPLAEIAQRHDPWRYCLPNPDSGVPTTSPLPGSMSPPVGSHQLCSLMLIGPMSWRRA